MNIPVADPLWIAVEPHYDDELMGPGFTDIFGRLYFVAWCLAAFAGTESTNLDSCHAVVDFHPAQERSFWIIWNWWRAHSRLCRLDADSGSGLGSGSGSSGRLGITRPPEFDYRVHLVEGAPYVLRARSPHSIAVIGLFQREFSPGLDSTPADLNLVRRRTAMLCACHAVTMECYRAAVARKLPGLRPLKSDLLLTVSQEPELAGLAFLGDSSRPGLDPRCHTGNTVDPCPWLPDDRGLPFYLWDRRSRCTVEVGALQERPVYTAISHTWGRWEEREAGRTKKARVRGVRGWEVPRNTLFDVESIPDILSRVPTSTRYVWLDLVCIPQDYSPRAVEEIARQAVIFLGAKHCITWMNSVTSWDGLRSAIDWMSLVFLDVDHVWLYDAPPSSSSSSPSLSPSFGRPHPDDTFRNANCTGLFDPYRITPDFTSADMTVSGWFSSLWTLQEVCLRPDMWLCNREWELLAVGPGPGTPVAVDTIAALTNECALRQEVRMSPMGDDEFGVGPGETEGEGGGGGGWKPHFHEAYSVNTPSRLFGPMCRLGRFHVGFLELHELLNRTGMYDLHVMHPKSILTLGSRRFCRERRAEAVMSVLGLRGWFATYAQQQQQQQQQQPAKAAEADLVLGQYPIAFVREAAAAMRATFFESLTHSTLSVPDIAREPPAGYRGSLMPFDSVLKSAKAKVLEEHFILYREYGVEEGHPSVATWAITHEGSVRMSCIGLVASSCGMEDEERVDGEGGQAPDAEGREGSSTIQCDVFLTHDAEDDLDNDALNPLHERGLRYRRVELRSWLGSYHSDAGPNYAVELMRGPWGSRGILLKKLSSPSPQQQQQQQQSPETLLKLGNFVLAEWHHANWAGTKTHFVNWLVL